MSWGRSAIDLAGRLPILGVCGFSGSGKTTLIEAVLPRLTAAGLKVAVLKHDVHTIEVDRPGKDSDRLFKAGADVFLKGGETLIRLHNDALEDLLAWLARPGAGYDLILVEGFKHSPFQKVWLLSDREEQPPDGVERVMAALSRQENRIEKFMALLSEFFTLMPAPRRPHSGMSDCGGANP